MIVRVKVMKEVTRVLVVGKKEVNREMYVRIGPLRT